MIQVKARNQISAGINYIVAFSLNLGDAMTVTPTFTTTSFSGNIYYGLSYPFLLYKLKSQQTGNEKIFTNTGINPAVGVNVNTFDRSITGSFKYSVIPSVTEDLSKGELKIGNADFPLGFYDLTIYQSETDGDLNPDNATATLYTGLLHFEASDELTTDTNFQAVKYKEYTTNDTDTEAVYITNTPN